MKRKRLKARQALKRLRAQYDESPQTNGEREVAAAIQDDWDAIEAALKEE